MTTKKNYSLLLILPRVQQGQSSVTHKGKLSPPPLSLPYIASLTPKNFEVSIVDENVNDIDFEKSVDIVGISVITMAAPRAYQIAHQFKGQGKTVVLGGIHPSMLPKEASKHADAIVIGEGEGIWQKLLMDFQRGKMEKIYKRGNLCNLKGLPYPRWELTKKDDYFM
ncbi:cobalamin-dependent protein, partial [Candidatus Babeliales bacterium]|nr:cobalamin-dependent protein [Candidatus Babeliales bacterium]